METKTKFNVGDKFTLSPSMGAVEYRITAIDSFGVTSHYGVTWQDADNNFQSGWMPVEMVDALAFTKSQTVFVVVTNGGYWGKGTTLKGAATECNKHGSRRTDLCVIRCLTSHTEQGNLLDLVTVDGMGAINYPSTAELIRIASPTDSNLIKLGNIL